RKTVAEDELLPGVVHLRPEDELAGTWIHCPAGEGARDFDDILLRVAAIDAQGVQLHQLPRVILIETAWAPLCLDRHSAWPACPAAEYSPPSRSCRRERWVNAVGRTLPIVEKEQHRWALGHRA